MWRHVHLDRSFLRLVFIASLCCAVYAQSGTDGRCGACPEECIGRRYWWTTMWGFIVTLIVLTLDVWGGMKSTGVSTSKRFFYTFLMSALNPLLIVWGMLDQALRGMAIRDNLREVLGDDMVAPLWPWSTSHIKIIVGSNVFVNLSPDVYEEVYNSNVFWNEGLFVRDLSEAFVIGVEVRDSNQYNVHLSRRGELALLRSNVLPPYSQLKFLRGSTNLGMTIAAAQAIGYIYGIVVRCRQGLRVSPIEVIACVLNTVVLMKIVIHNFASLGHRPLLLYLLPEQEAKFIEECKITMSYQFDTQRRLKVGVSIKVVILLVVGGYFIINSMKSLSRTCIAPIIIFYMSLIFGGFLGLTLDDENRLQYIYSAVNQLLLFITLMLNTVGYVWALIATFKYWKVEEFDVHSSNYLSQVLPYIG